MAKKKTQDEELKSRINDAMQSVADDDGEEAATPVEEELEEEKKENEKTHFWSKDEEDAEGEVETVETFDETQGKQVDEPEIPDHPNPEPVGDLPEDDHHPMPPSSSHPLGGIEEKQGDGKKPLVIGGVVVFVLALLGGAYFMLRPAATQEEVAGEATEAIPASAEPMAAATEVVDLTEYGVQVLNGSGTPGEAGKVQSLLEEAGFEDIETGNAKAYTFKSTQISAVPGTPQAVIDKVKEALSADYVVEVGEGLSDDSDYDVVVTTGSSKAE